jgi:autophagy-related protein 27
LDGGRSPFGDKKNGVAQKAIIEMICDKERTGLEGDEEDDRPKVDDKKSKRDDEDGEKKTKSLEFVSYESKGSPEMGTLRLMWRTKYACEDAVDHPDKNPQSGWGGFTWFLIM